LNEWFSFAGQERKRKKNSKPSSFHQSVNFLWEHEWLMATLMVFSLFFSSAGKSIKKREENRSYGSPSNNSCKKKQDAAYIRCNKQRQWTSSETRLPAEFKHINKRRKRN
jgi:hypothetical protein